MKNHEILSKNHEKSWNFIEKSWNFIEKSWKIMKFHRKIIKNHQIPSKKQSKLNQMLNRFSFDSRYVFEQNDHILSRIIRTKSLLILTLLWVSLMQKLFLFFDSMMRWLSGSRYIFSEKTSEKWCKTFPVTCLLAACCCWLAGWTGSSSSIFNS